MSPQKIDALQPHTTEELKRLYPFVIINSTEYIEIMTGNDRIKLHRELIPLLIENLQNPYPKETSLELISFDPISLTSDSSQSALPPSKPERQSRGNRQRFGGDNRQPR